MFFSKSPCALWVLSLWTTCADHSLIMVTWNMKSLVMSLYITSLFHFWKTRLQQWAKNIWRCLNLEQILHPLESMGPFHALNDQMARSRFFFDVAFLTIFFMFDWINSMSDNFRKTDRFILATSTRFPITSPFKSRSCVLFVSSFQTFTLLSTTLVLLR